MDLEGLVADREPLSSCSVTSGLPAARASVGNMSMWETMPFSHGAGLDLARPAHEAGHAPAAFPVGVLLLRNGVLPPSGQVSFCGPLSVEYMTMVLSAMPSSSSLSSIWPICSSWTTMRSL